MNGIDHLERVVKGIYKAEAAATFGTEGNLPLPESWQQFFRKKSQELRKQELKPEVEPEKEPEAKEDETLVKIIEAIIERIKALEDKIEILETAQGLEELEEEPEPIRKWGLDPETFLLKMQLEGAHGELRTREGRKWQKSS